jgi:adenylate kinase
MRHSKKLVICILGRPGSGKGTQAKLLVKKFGLAYFGSGEALRNRRKIKDFTGKKLFGAMEKGVLAPAFVISKLWMDALEKIKQKSKGVVMDGSPRQLIEAKFFNDALEWYEWQREARVILLEISKKESFNRLTKRRQCKKCGRLIPWMGKFKEMKRCDKCGGLLISRTDDKPAAIKKRLEEFEEKVVPVLDYFKKKGKLRRVNGEQSIEDVFKDILKSLK